MSVFTWQDHYKIGDSTVDTQHQLVFDLANQIIEATDTEEITRLVMLFYKHIREHFQVEEDLMKQHQYPEYAMHVEAHNVMIDKLNDISKSVHSRQWTQDGVRAFVNGWLLGHILELDLNFGKFLKGHGQA